MTKKVKHVKAVFKITSDGLAYDNLNKFEKDFGNFKTDNIDGWGEVTFKAVDRVKHYQHKYYRGEILEALAQSKDAKDYYMLHLNLKADLLFKKADNWDEIPEQYMEKGVAVVDKKDLYDVKIPSGRTIILLHDKELVGYIPSHGCLSQEEMKEYIKRCEDIRDNLFDWIPSEEAAFMRDQIFDEQGDLW